MSRIENYEQYCKAYNEEESDARLLLYVQDWIIRVLGFMEEDAMDFSLNVLLEKNAHKLSLRDSQKDALSKIIADTELPFRYIVEHMREKILRENVQMPVYKVREINGYGLSWLSRQSGKTIKQKVSSAGNSIMAVQRRMSLDTGENRLFIAFVRQLQEYLQIKLDNHVPGGEEEYFCRELAAFLHREEIEEIKRWENLAPNNTLLSDQNYKKIWYGWNGMKKLDDRIRDDYRGMDIRLAVIFFVELLTQARELVRIPQMPAEVDYDGYRIHLGESRVDCLDPQGNGLTMWRQENCIHARRAEKESRALIAEKKITIFVEGDRVAGPLPLNAGNITKCAQVFLVRTGVGVYRKNGRKPRQDKEKYKKVIMDLFSLHPKYTGDGGAVQKMAARILQQKYIARDMNGEERHYYIPCDRANAIKMEEGVTETYTVPWGVSRGSMEQMKRLMHMMEGYISTDSFTYVMPDVYNEFQLNLVHKAARMAYGKVKNIPLSIGAAFAYESTREFQEGFQDGDFLLIVNLVEDELTFTLVEGKYESRLEEEIPECGGIIWERHPTASLSCAETVYDRIIDPLIKMGCAQGEKVYGLMGLEGLQDPGDQLSFCFGEGEWFEVKPEIRQWALNVKINVNAQIVDFLEKRQSVVEDLSRVHVILTAEQLINKGRQRTCYETGEEVLKGCVRLESLQERTDILLWYDHLPNLAIKQLYGKFDLIRGVKVAPRFDKKQNIEIKNTFTLPKNWEEYHFNLVQEDNSNKIQYEAVIRNPAFPLKKDTECRLVMSYQYGAEESYELTFVPVAPKEAGFAEAKVYWKKIEEYPWTDLDSPDFPACMTWEELKSYPGKTGEPINIYEELMRQYDLIRGGYETWDVSGCRVNQDKNGSRYGYFFYEKSGESLKVKWDEKFWEKGAKKPKEIGEISFLLKEKARTTPRYRIEDLMAVRTKSNLWFVNSKGIYQCNVWFRHKEEEKSLAVYENHFDDPDNFSPEINDISFEVWENADGTLKAVNVHDESGAPYVPVKEYYADKLHGGKTPPRHFVNTYFVWLTRVFFANNRSLADRQCPEDFQRAFAGVVKDWVGLFDQYEDKADKCAIFTCLSLGAQNIGRDYYDIARRVLEMYSGGEIKLEDIPYEIGCGLGDLSQKNETDLLERIFSEIPDPAARIGILSKALWHNERFVFNGDREMLLRNLDSAIDVIGAILAEREARKTRKNDLKKVGCCLEYILGVLRLRRLHDPTINRKYLSMNHPKMRELYQHIETMVSGGIDISSFLKLEIRDKGSYQQISDLMYALLVYITGQNAEGEIKISVSMENMEEQ